VFRMFWLLVFLRFLAGRIFHRNDGMFHRGTGIFQQGDFVAGKLRVEVVELVAQGLPQRNGGLETIVGELLLRDRRQVGEEQLQQARRQAQDGPHVAEIAGTNQVLALLHEFVVFEAEAQGVEDFAQVIGFQADAFGTSSKTTKS